MNLPKSLKTRQNGPKRNNWHPLGRRFLPRLRIRPDRTQENQNPGGPQWAVLVSADNGRPGPRVLEREDRHDHEADNHEDDAGWAEQVLRPRRVS